MSKQVVIQPVEIKKIEQKKYAFKMWTSETMNELQTKFSIQAYMSYAIYGWASMNSVPLGPIHPVWFDSVMYCLTEPAGSLKGFEVINDLEVTSKNYEFCKIIIGAAGVAAQWAYRDMSKYVWSKITPPTLPREQKPHA